MVFTTGTFPEDIAAREIMSRTSSPFSPESTRASWHPGKKDSGPEIVPWCWAESSSQVGAGHLTIAGVHYGECAAHTSSP